MNEIYWITRLDLICGVLSLIAVFSVVATVVLFFIGLLKRDETDIYDEGSKTWKRHIETSKMCLYFAKRCAIVFFVSVFINFFIPTTNEALLIYGVGGTIDYIKSNDTAKQLPDKCVKALDKYLDNLTKEENQKQNEQ